MSRLVALIAAMTLEDVAIAEPGNLRFPAKNLRLNLPPAQHRQLDLNEETFVLLNLLMETIEADRYPLSPSRARCGQKGSETRTRAATAPGDFDHRLAAARKAVAPSEPITP